MTSKLTREKAQWLHDACEEAADAGIKLTMNPNELLMFTSYALTAMDSEPVGTFSVRAMSYSGKKFGTQFGFVHSDAAMKVPEGDYPLYRHEQPAPVVPDAIPVSRDIDAGYLSGWNDCRAAMLSGGKS